MTRPCEHCSALTEEYALRTVRVGQPAESYAVCPACWHSLSSRANYASKPIQGALSVYFEKAGDK